MGALRGVLGCLGGWFGRPGAVLKRLGHILGAPGRFLKACWAQLGPLREILAPSWGHLGAMLGHLGAIGRVLRVSQKRLRPLFGSRRFVFSLFLDMLLYVFMFV